MTLFSTSFSTSRIFAWLRCIVSVVALGLTACDRLSENTNASPENSPGASARHPQRIVSLDFCADQYALKMADRGHILALSPDAEQPHAYLRKQAAGLPTVRPSAEQIIALAPDLVLRTYGGGAGIEHLLRRLDIPVVNIGWTSDIDSIKRVTLEVAHELGVPERGTGIVAELESRIAALPKAQERPSALYMTPAGATTGPGSLIHELLVTSGMNNFQQRNGWHSLPLERLAYERPDRIVAAFFDTNGEHASQWSAMRHPVARKQLRDAPVTYLSGAWMSCGAWFIANAAEVLAADAVEAPLKTNF